jgi:hypothetical protein
MISFFTIPSGDQSVYYLGRIFGNMGTLFITNNASGLMGVIFQAMNTAALTLGTAILVHASVVGLLRTAQEGEFLGKDGHSLWGPVRMVVGIISLFPLASGYSMVQVVMMWIILQGVGAADALWGSVLSYVAVTGSPNSGVGGPSPMSLSTPMGVLFTALTCQASAKYNESEQKPIGANPPLAPLKYTLAHADDLYYFYCDDPENQKKPFCLQSQQEMLDISAAANTQPTTLTDHDDTYKGIIYNMGPPHATCGTLTYAAPEQDGCPGLDSDTIKKKMMCGAQAAQQKILQSIVSTLGLLAASFVQADAQYMHFYEDTTETAKPVQFDWINHYCKDPARNIPLLPSTTSINAKDLACCVMKPLNVMGIVFPSPGCVKRAVTPGDSASPFYFDSTIVSIEGAATTFSPASQNRETVKNIIWPYAIYAKVGDDSKVVTYASNYYATSVNNALTATIASQRPIALNDWKRDAQHLGWIYAGAYYYKLVSSNGDGIPTTPYLAVQGAGDGTGNPYPTGNYLYRTNIDAALSVLESAAATPTPSPSATAGNAFSNAGSDILNRFMNNLTAGGSRSDVSMSILINLAHFGEALMISAQVLYPIMILTFSLLAMFASIDPIEVGTGLVVNPALPLIQTVNYFILPVLLIFCGWCITFGALIGIYVPLIPYIFFLFASIGWFSASIEAMAASPFVAIGILSPGQSELWGRAEPTLMIILNTFLRPMMMVFGLIVAMFLAPVVVNLINHTFINVMHTLTFGGNPGPLEIVLYITAYATMVVTALNKCFSLIYEVPNKILTWIGGQAVSYGEEESANAIRRAVEGVAGAAKAGLNASTEKGAHQLQAQGEKSHRGVGGQGGKGGDTSVKGQ